MTKIGSISGFKETIVSKIKRLEAENAILRNHLTEMDMNVLAILLALSEDEEMGKKLDLHKESLEAQLTEKIHNLVRLKEGKDAKTEEIN